VVILECFHTGSTAQHPSTALTSQHKNLLINIVFSQHHPTLNDTSSQYEKGQYMQDHLCSLNWLL